MEIKDAVHSHPPKDRLIISQAPCASILYSTIRSLRGFEAQA
jgi:hypothetical protein